MLTSKRRRGKGREVHQPRFEATWPLSTIYGVPHIVFPLLSAPTARQKNAFQHTATIACFTPDSDSRLFFFFRLRTQSTQKPQHNERRYTKTSSTRAADYATTGSLQPPNVSGAFPTLIPLNSPNRTHSTHTVPGNSFLGPYGTTPCFGKVARKNHSSSSRPQRRSTLLVSFSTSRFCFCLFVTFCGGPVFFSSSFLTHAQNNL